MRKLAVLGSTGSIGRGVLEVVDLFRDRFTVEALAAGGNVALLQRQIDRFSPRKVSVRSRREAERLKAERPHLEVLWGEEGLVALASAEEVDLVVIAVVGAVGLRPTLAALQEGKRVALATKEVMVMAGEWVMRRAEERGVEIVPVDSEHSALFQALGGKRKAEAIRRLILTASGGPFYHLPVEEMQRAGPDQALRHPVWKMGPKISVDSATLMNKGLEVIEARWLFDLPPERIEVLIHPQGIVHGMVEFVDGSVIAQMSRPDMKIPIAYALSYPERLPLPYPVLDLHRSGPLTFHPPDLERFPALGLAREALEAGGTMPAVLNAADEIAVEAFLKGRIPLGKVVEVVRRVLERHTWRPLSGVEEVLEADRWAREEARKVLEGIR